MQIRIRDVNKDDAYDLWSWRNHPEVRKWAFNSEEIDYAGHKRWFDKTVKAEDIRIYIAENESKQKVGQIRFEIDKDRKAYISINLNPDFFAKGLGNKVIKIATEDFLKKKPDIKDIIAEVIKENIVSRKAFEKAGYLLLGEDDKEGRRIEIFTYRKKINK